MSKAQLYRALHLCGSRERDIVAGVVNGSTRQLSQAVRPEEQRGTLKTRERFNATQALGSLASLASKELPAIQVTDSLYGDPTARAALSQVHSISIRIVAEAGSAALAAASGRHSQTDQQTLASLAVPKEGSAAAWAEALQCSSKLLSCMLKEIANCVPETVEDDDYDAGSLGALQVRDRRAIVDAAAALLCTDSMEALSRLLAAEEHRGPNAVLDTDAAMDAVGVLSDLAYAASLWLHWDRALPTLYSNSRAYNVGNERGSPACCAAPQAQGPQPGESQGHRPEPEKQKDVSWVVMEALARSRAVEHVCRFTVQRLTGADRRTGLPSKAAAGHLRGVLSLLDSVHSISLSSRVWGSAADAEAVLLSRNIQYLLHLHVVSQLHAVDGGTTYGLPYDKLLPPIRSPAGEALPGSPALLECQGIETALGLWNTALGLGGSASWPSGVRPKSLMELLMRTAQVALDSWEQGARARATGEQREVGQQLRGGAGHARGGGGGGLAPLHSGNGGNGGLAASGPRAVLDVAKGPGLALRALDCSKCLLRSRHPCDGGVCGRGSCSSSRAGGGDGMGQVLGDGLGGGASDGSSVSCDGEEGNGDNTSSAGATGGLRQQPWLSWARRRRFAGRWWRLLVRAVHAELDADGSGQKEAGADDIWRCLSVILIPLRMNGPTGAAACPGGSPPAAPCPPPLPACWLSAAVSAGYIPCMERLIRSTAAEARRPTTLLASRAPLVRELLEGRSLAALAAAGEERQAAALLVTAIKATADIAVNWPAVPAAVNSKLWRDSGEEQLAVECFAAIPGAMAELTLELLQLTRGGGGGGNGDGTGGGGGGAGGPSAAACAGTGCGAGRGSGGDTYCLAQSSAGAPAPEAGAEQQGGNGAVALQQPGAQTAQQQRLGKLLRLLSLCLARWLPLSAVLLWTPAGKEEHPARRPMLRLVELARKAAQGRGTLGGRRAGRSCWV